LGKGEKKTLGCWKSGEKAFVFSLEAGLSLLVCVLLVGTLSLNCQEDLSEVLVYKQASDFLEVALRSGWLEEKNVTQCKTLLSETGWKARLVVGGNALIDECGPHQARIVVNRTLVTKKLEYVPVSITACF
jgi:hypothetical protein